MENSFNIGSCQEIGCNKVVDVVVCSPHSAPANLVWHKCGAYQTPDQLACHRHGKTCPAGPRKFDKVDGHKVRVGQQKQKKTS